MGSLAKARKRANSRKNSAMRKARDKVVSGGRHISSDDRKRQIADDNLKNAPLSDPVAKMRALENQFVSRGGLTDAEIRGINKVRSGQGFKAVSHAFKKNEELAKQKAFSRDSKAKQQSAKQNLKLAQASLNQHNSEISKSKIKIASLRKQLDASREAWKNGNHSRAMIRRGNQQAVSISNSIKSESAKLSGLQSTLPESQANVKQAEKTKMKSEINLDNKKEKTIDPKRPTSLNQFANKNKEQQKVIVGKGNVPGLIGGINILQANSQGVKESHNKVLGATWVKSDDAITSLKKGFERTFETNKPVKERSDLNQKLVGVASPITNLGADVADYITALQKGKDGFTPHPISGIPEAKQVHPRTDTAFSQLLSGRKVQIDDPVIQGSIVGDVGFIAGLGATGLKGFGVKSSSPKVPTPKQSIVGEVAKQGPIQLRPGPPRNVFAQDTALGLEKELFPLGKGPGGFFKTDKGTKLTGNSFDGLFGKGKKTTTKKFDEPKINKGDKLVGKGGSQQILKTKEQSITKVLGGKTNVTLKNFGKIKQKTQSTKTDLLHKTPKRNKQHQGGGLIFEFSQLQKGKTTPSLKLGQFTKQKSGQKQGPKQLSKQAFKPVTKQQAKQTVTPKQTPKVAQAFTPIVLPQTTLPVPFKPIPQRVTPRFAPGIPLFPAGGGGSFMGASRGSSFRKYTTTAISTDINQKILPGKFLKTSKSKKIFRDLDKLQAKEDKKTSPTFLFGGKTQNVKGKPDKKKSGKGLPVVSGNTARALGL